MVKYMQIGDLVTIKNDKLAIVYKIMNIENDQAHLKGYSHRTKKTVSLNEVEKASNLLIEKENKVNERYKKVVEEKTRKIPQKKPMFGRILHIDGDKEYLDSCLELYKEMGINAVGVYIDENKVKNKIEALIEQLTPDIIVITGHDLYNNKGIKDLNNYENTRNFMDAIRKVRKHYLSDEVCVIAGACGSNFEALIASGANFASSPKRINIHTYDPAVIAIRVASTSINKTIDFEACLKLIENGKHAFGGIETKGKMKLFM